MKNLNFDEIFGEFSSLFGKSLDDFKKNVKTETGKDSNGEYERIEYSSPDNSIKFVSLFRTSTNKSTDEISVLRKQMNDFAKSEEFEKAAEVRDKIKSLEYSINEINTLKKELDEAVQSENFEKAIELRDKISKLKE